jgi:hypothetical protein
MPAVLSETHDQPVNANASELPSYDHPERHPINSLAEVKTVESRSWFLPRLNAYSEPKGGKMFKCQK